MEESSHADTGASAGIGNYPGGCRPTITEARLINPTTVEVLFANNQRMTIDFYGENIFRLFQDNSVGIIRNTALLFEGLQPETTYTFRIRAVNKDGHSDWSEFKATTQSNPLEFAIRGIKGEVSAPDQEGFEVERLFDFAELGDINKNGRLIHPQVQGQTETDLRPENARRHRGEPETELGSILNKRTTTAGHEATRPAVSTR